MPELILDPQDGTPPLVLDWQDGYAIQNGPLGLGLPPRKIVERMRVDGHGTDLVATIIGARDITVPLDVYGATRQQFRQRRNRLQTICGRSTHARPIRVTYRDDAGVPEWMQGTYVGGLDGDERAGDDRSELFAIVLRDGCPYWRGPRVDESWGLRRPTPRPWFPVLGSSPSASAIGGRRTLFVPGSAEVYPPWVVEGPGTRLTIHNRTAGWRVVIDHEIPSVGPASVITVTTAPGEQAVRDGHGVNLFGAITNGPKGGWTMGPLLPGDNELEVTLRASGDRSSVAVSYDPLLLAA